MSNIPRRNLASGCHLLKKLINLHGGQLDVTTNIYLKSCAYHPDSECCPFFHRNLSDPKSSEDTLLYLYDIGNMLKSASATFLEIDCDEIPVPPAVLQGY